MEKDPKGKDVNQNAFQRQDIGFFSRACKIKAAIAKFTVPRSETNG